MHTESRFFPLTLAAAYIAYSIVIRLVIEVFTGVVLVGTLLADGQDLMALDAGALEGALNATLLGAASGVQLLALGAGAIVMARFLDGSWQDNLGLRKPAALGIAVGAIGGFTVGFFPGWLAGKLSEALPWLDMGNLELLNQMLLDADVLGRVVLIVAICLFAPLFEELVFRGFLWEALERVMPAWVVWLVTSAAFAIYHIDPIHVAAVFFTGLFLGWLRLRTDSVWPSVLAHLGNNCLAAITVFTGMTESEVEPSLVIVGAATVITLGLAASLMSPRAAPEVA